MPRAYRLGRRAEQKDATRSAILAASAALYAERGISHTSMAQIARRADVAPGTVLNHFPTKDALDAALVEDVFAELRLPELSIYDGLDSLAERVDRLVREAAAFMARSERWYLMWAREPSWTGPWGEAVNRFYGRQEELLRAALGELATDDDALTMLRASIDPRFLGALGEAGRSREQAAALISTALTPWLQERLRARVGA